MRQRYLWLLAVMAGLILAGCGGAGTVNPPADGDETEDEAGPEQEAACVQNALKCQENVIMKCKPDGADWVVFQICDEDRQCVTDQYGVASCVSADGDLDEEEPVETPDGDDAGDDDSLPELDEDSGEPPSDLAEETVDEQELDCTSGQRRCSEDGTRAEVCMPGGMGWMLAEMCAECQYCHMGHCLDNADCEVEQEEPEEEQDPEPEEEPDLGCTPATDPSYCQGKILWRCQAPDMVQLNCAAIDADCMVGDDDEAHCIGQEGAMCLPDDPYGCVQGLSCEDYQCKPPGGCADMRQLLEGASQDSTIGAGADIVRGCLPRDFPGNDAIYRFSVGQAQVVEVSLSGPDVANAGLYILSDCADLASCMPATYLGSDSHLRFEAPASGTYYLVVDGAYGGFNYTINVDILESSVCATAYTITGNIILEGDTRGQGRNFNPGSSCRYGSLSAGAPGQEVFYKLEIGKDQAVTAHLDILSPGVDAVLYVLDDCETPQCEYGMDDGGINEAEETTVGTSAARTVIVVVDEKSDVGFEYRLVINYVQNGGCDASPVSSSQAVFTLAVLLGFAARALRRGRV